MKTQLLALVMLAGGSALAADISIGIQIGAPPPVVVVPVRPPCPGPEWLWVDGYWYPVGHRYRWHEGYWTRPPYEGAFWIGPRYEDGRYFAGYWQGGHGRFEHDHHWDRDDERDFRRGWREHDDDDHGHGHGHGRGHDR